MRCKVINVFSIFYLYNIFYPNLIQLIWINLISITLVISSPSPIYIAPVLLRFPSLLPLSLSLSHAHRSIEQYRRYSSEQTKHLLRREREERESEDFILVFSLSLLIFYNVSLQRWWSTSPCHSIKNSCCPRLPQERYTHKFNSPFFNFVFFFMYKCFFFLKVVIL